jgi:hypothetical protein
MKPVRWLTCWQVSQGLRVPRAGPTTFSHDAANRALMAGLPYARTTGAKRRSSLYPAAQPALLVRRASAFRRTPAPATLLLRARAPAPAPPLSSRAAPHGLENRLRRRTGARGRQSSARLSHPFRTKFFRARPAEETDSAFNSLVPQG